MPISQSNLPTKKNSNLSILKSYNQYFSSGTYHKRYPDVNRNTLHFIHRHLTKNDAKILDYGCGNGRYLLKLLDSMRQISAIAFDISATALETLEESLQEKGQTSRVTLRNKMGHSGNKADSYNNILLLFGVLSHIKSRNHRINTLTSLRKQLSKNGTIILSVPNRNRRFLQLQKQQKESSIIYTRYLNGVETSFFYHLYDIDSIKKELNKADLQIIEVKAESVFPETWVTQSKLIGWIDYQLCKVFPVTWGYGILISCKSAHCVN